MSQHDKIVEVDKKIIKPQKSDGDVDFPIEIIINIVEKNKTILKLLCDKKIKYNITWSLSTTLSTLGMYYTTKQVKDSKSYFHLISFVAQDPDKLEDFMRKQLNKWNGEMKLLDNIGYRTDVESIFDLIKNFKIKICVKCEGKFSFSVAKNVTLIFDPTNLKKTIQPNFKYTHMKQEGVNFHFFNETNIAWQTQYTNIVFQFHLPLKVEHYKLFNLLHVLEHCLLQNTKNFIDDNGTTSQANGNMNIQFTCESGNLEKAMSDINAIIESKDISSRIEFTRVGFEMYQQIQIKYTLMYMGMLFNKDIPTRKLDGHVLFDLYTQLVLTDVYVQNSGPEIIKPEKQIKKISLKQYTPTSKYIDKYFEDMGEYKRLIFLNERIWDKFKIKSDMDRTYICIIGDLLRKIFFFEGNNLYVFHEEYFETSICQELYVKTDEFFDDRRRFIDFGPETQCLMFDQGLIDQLQYQGFIKIPEDVLGRVEKIFNYKVNVEQYTYAQFLEAERQQQNI